MHPATMVVIILAAGLASQWLAARFRLPAIVVLITAGLVLGPMTGVVHLTADRDDITELIGLGVAIILFEGAMDLRLEEYRRVGPGVRRLTMLGPPLAWVLGALAAHYAGGLSWAVSWVLGAILVVTGPTVIMPLLRQERLNKRTASLLKWEGIVNDPVGVLLAVLAFGYVTAGEDGLGHTILALLGALVAAALFGGLGGFLTARLYQRGLVPFHLKAPLLMAVVLVVFWASNLIQHEAGLLSVTVMGVLFANMKLVERERLLHFKENLTLVLVSVLFIVIPSQLDADQLRLVDWRVLLFVLVTLVLVRPATIALATLGGPMSRRDKALLGWIAPRGIVAAATAGVVGPALAEAGYADAELLLPIVFLVILVTVLAHGLTLGPLARRLGLAAGAANGLLVVGGSRWAGAFAATLERHDVSVLVVDGAYDALKPVRGAGIPTYFGEILSDAAEHDLEVGHLSYLLCATDNDYYNALVCRTKGALFGHHRTFQLATHQQSRQEHKRLALQRRGYYAFDAETDFHTLDARMGEGWAVRATKLTADFDFAQLSAQLDERDPGWVLLAIVSAGGTLRMYSAELPFTPEPGATVLHFSPVPAKERAASTAAGSDAADAPASGAAAPGGR